MRAGLRLAVDAAVDRVTDVRDVAAVQLARTYAQAIDSDPETLPEIGPKLLSCLAQLGLTPVARGVAKGDGDAKPIVSKLDELRARRRRRDTG